MNTRKKIHILLLILGIVTLVMVIFIIYPLFKGIRENSQDFLFQKGELALLRIKLAYLRGFERTHIIRKGELDKINALFINPEAPVGLVNFLENTARNCRVSIAISPVTSQKDKTDLWPSVAFQINTAGTFSDFSRFLEKIEASPWLIEILDLEIRKTGVETIDASFLIKVYSK